jgi:signal transduction histidine kinase
MRIGGGALRRVGGGLRRVDPREADAVLALVLAALGSADLARPVPHGSAVTPADLLGHALVVAVCAAVAVRRIVPRTALAGALLLIAVLSVLGYRQSPVGLPLAVLVYTVGTRYRLGAAAPVTALLAVVVVVSYTTSREPVPPSDLAVLVAYLVASWVVGASIRRRRDDLARQAVAAERLRIARELHDVVAHSMSVVAVLSGVAMHLLDADPERTRACLAVIASSSRRALDEMRRLLQVLRPDAASGELSPVPGLRDLPALAKDMEAAGLAVRLDMEGVPEDPPPAVALTAYRIVQEALTNTLRHAGAGSSADVRVRYGPDDVEVDVLDDGRGSAALPSAGAGAGLAGMRERVALFGGTLDVGRRPGGGWSVSARLPLAGESR